MSLEQFGTKSIRSHSIHVAIGRDYQRAKIAQKLDAKLRRDFLNFQRRLSSHAKWNERALANTLRQNPTTTVNNPQERPPVTLEEFLQREKIKQENILNAKNVANKNIRRR